MDEVVLVEFPLCIIIFCLNGTMSLSCQVPISQVISSFHYYSPVFCLSEKRNCESFQKCARISFWAIKQLD
ncbi:uncharacterized protein EDB93DRAFT_1132331 [Suillus bovinus]|uniref:uncharacterized protein n=1 Tax=Suillus bovinus TaxID=48563 RepID=UPI001B85D0F4|nr:uncharacterized protein EDB93DRAFT_1132331 [Suillus bovinus]KAG2154447.1 hypothetical protein EDB93DRAFT_1132331 [Suillus bovinus]